MCNTKSFILHTDTLAVLDEMTDAQAGKLFKAIKEYQLSGAERCEQDVEADTDSPLKDFVIRIAFAPFRAQFERDAEKYEKKVEKNRENGSKGGRPKKSEKTQSVFEEPKKADSDSDSDSDSDISTTTTEKENSTKKEIDTVVSAYNTECLSMRPLKIITAKRKQTINARIREHSIETVLEVITKASKSPFLAGDASSGWTADFDWIMKPTNFIKTLEGKYDERTTQTPASANRGNNNPTATQQHTAADRAQGYTDGLVSILNADDPTSSGLVPRL